MFQKLASFYRLMSLILLMAWVVCCCQPAAAMGAGENVIEGRVVDINGKPVPSARVALANAMRGFINYDGTSPERGRLNVHGQNERVLWFFPKRNGQASTIVETDAEGRFRATGLMDGKFNVMAVHDERGMAVLADVAYPTSDKALKIELLPPAHAEGRIAGLPKERWASMGQIAPAKGYPRVQISGWLKLGDDGRFRSGLLPAHESAWTIGFEDFVSKRGYSATLLSVPVTLSPGKTAVVDVDLTAGSGFAGQVRGPRDEPLEYVSVVARTISDNPRAYGAITDALGKYALRGLPPGKYTLEAKRWARRTAPG